MAKQNVMCPYDCVLSSSNKGLKSWYMLQNGWTWKTLSERSHTEKTIYYMTPVIRIIQKRQIHRDKSKLVVARRWGEGKRKKWLLNGYGVSCGCGENVLELDRDGYCMHANVLNSTELYNLVCLIVCYVNFPSIKKKDQTKNTWIPRHYLLLGWFSHECLWDQEPNPGPWTPL